MTAVRRTGKLFELESKEYVAVDIPIRQPGAAVFEAAVDDKTIREGSLRPGNRVEAEIEFPSFLLPGEKDARVVRMRKTNEPAPG